MTDPGIYRCEYNFKNDVRNTEYEAEKWIQLTQERV